MNYKREAQSTADCDLAEQAQTVQGLIEDMIKCCEERRIYENQKFGVPYAELRCLLLFNRDQEYMTVKSIAHRLDVAKSRVTKLINGLLHKGLVTRFDAPHDTRVKLVCLTQKGRNKVAEVQAFHTRVFQNLLQQIPEEEREHVVHQLHRVRDCMEKVKKTLA